MNERFAMWPLLAEEPRSMTAVNPDTTAVPKKTAAEKRKERAAKVKEANKRRLEILAKQKEERKKLREKAKAAEPAPDPVKEVAKKAKAAEQKAAREAKEKTIAEAQKQLAPIAKEVNHRLAEAQKMDGKADDHRLAAALRLKEAEEQCKAAGIKFKDWSTKNVHGYSFETVRYLVRIGKAPEPLLALQDLRARNAASNKRLRERRKEELEEAREQRQSQPKEVVGGTVSRDPSPRETLDGLDAMKAAFGELRASEQMDFVEWAANEVGAKIDATV